MASPSIPVSQLINIQVFLSPPAAQAEAVDTLVMVGTSNVIDVVERMRTYASIEEVLADFSNVSPEYLSAVLWFEQQPQPDQINIGRWFNSGAVAGINGGPLTAAQQAIAAWTSISSGSFLLTSSDQYLAVTGVNLSGATNLNGVASLIQAAATGYTVVWDSPYSRFELRSTSSNTLSMGFLEAPSAVGNYSFTTGSPAVAADTVTLNGTAITFVASGATGLQVNVGTAIQEAVALAALINANPTSDTQLAKFEAIVRSWSTNPTVYLRAVTPGTGGNSLTIAKSGTGISVSGATLAGGAGTDLSADLGMTSTSSGAYVIPHQAIESALDAVQALDNAFGNKWYGLTIPAASDSDVLAIANYIEATTTKHFYGVTSSEGGILVPTDTTNIAYQLKLLGLDKTMVQYSSTNPYAVISALARILTTQWGGNNTAITLGYKQEPGIVPEHMGLAQMRSIKGFNANVFLEYSNDTAILQPIVCTASGQPVDTIIGLDWLVITMQNDAYNLLYTSPTKVPQTDAGMNLIATTLSDSLKAGVNNGLLAPGTWRQTGFGAIKQNDFLPDGFYIFTPKVATQNLADRQSRQSVPFQIAAVLGGSVEFVNVRINVSI